MASLPALQPDTFRVWLPNPESPMSLKPTPIGPISELTSYAARAAFPDGKSYLSVRDALGTFHDDQRFADLFPDRRRPAEGSASPQADGSAPPSSSRSTNPDSRPGPQEWGVIAARPKDSGIAARSRRGSTRRRGPARMTSFGWVFSSILTDSSNAYHTPGPADVGLSVERTEGEATPAVSASGRSTPGRRPA